MPTSSDRRTGPPDAGSVHAVTAPTPAATVIVPTHRGAHRLPRLLAALEAQDLPEPWEMNVTALKDPTRLKWKELVEAGTPLPTPWSKEAFEKARLALRAEHDQLLHASY